MPQEPLVGISELTYPDTTFAEDLAILSELGVAGIGIMESKLGDGDDGPKIEALKESGVKAAVCLVAQSSPLPTFPRIIKPGPEDPKERVALMGTCIRRMAKFDPATIVLVTGSARDRDPAEARRLIVEGLREAAHVAGELGIDVSLEALRSDLGYDASIVKTLPETIELIEEIGLPNVGVCYDTNHMWDSEGIIEDTEKYAKQIFSVQVNDWRDPPRALADRLIPGDGIIDLPGLFGALDRGGFDRWYDIELVSDDGRWGTELEDSLYKLPPRELFQRSMDGFARCWEARR